MAAGWLLDDPDEEAAVFARIERTRQTLATYSNTPQAATLAQNLSGISFLHGGIAPGAALALAKEGYGPDHPVTQAAAQAAAKADDDDKGWGWHSIGDIARGAGRVGLAALAAPYEAAQAQFRNIASGDPRRIVGGGLSTVLGPQAAEFVGGEQADPLSQTTIGVLGEQAAAREVNTGSGFFVAGEAAAEQSRRARAAGSVTYTTGDQQGQHALTPGRFVAKFVSEPGSGAYRVLSGLTDASLALADPTGKGLGRSRAFVQATPEAPVAVRLGQRALASRRAADVTAETGLVNGTRQTVLPEVADRWFASREGRRVTQWMAETDDFQTLWLGTRKKVPVRLLDDLTRATTPEEVQDILRPAIGITVRERPQAWGLRPEVRKRFGGVRVFQGMPGSGIDLSDPDAAVETLDRFQRNARLPQDVIARNNAQLAAARSPTEAYRVVVEDVLGGAKGLLVQGGTDPARARALTRAWANRHEELTRYAVDEIGENAIVPGAVIDGAGKAAPTPHLYAEHLHTIIPLPNARDVRRATSRYRRLLENPAVALGVAAGDFFMQDVWKPMMLLRGAWTIRVVGEEQVRMGASGLNSLMAHPMSAIAWVAGRKGGQGLTGEALEDAEEFAKAVSQRSGGWRDDMIRTRHKILVRREDEDFARSWADELAQLYSDPVGRPVAAGGLGPDALTPNPQPGIPGIQDWFFNGPGRKFRLEMAEATGKDTLLTREGSDEYVNSVLRRVLVKTGGQEELLDATATGRIGGARLSEGGRPARGALARLAALAEDGVGPEVVKGDLVVSARKGNRDFAQRYDSAVETMFNVLMTKPTNRLSRSSAFKQFYWKRAEELLPFMDDTAQQQAIQAARGAGLQDLALRMERQRKVSATAGTLTLADADVVAKGFGLDQTKRLLYDLSEKSQWADTMRLVFPFGEAWKEILTRWASLGLENPGAPKKAAQFVQGARGQGFFTTNEQGEEVFNYPGTGWLTQRAVGVNAPLQGRVQGLNLFSSSVLPGVGPVISMPAGQLLPDRPEWDGVRDIILPFGEPDTTGGVAESFLPPWLQKFRIALDKGSPEQDRQYANTVMDLARAMAQSGQYPTNTPEQVDRLMTQARRNAKVLYAIRGGAQFFAPSAPTPAVHVKDREGRVIVADLLVKDYRQMQDTLGYDEAVGAFLDKYGEGALLYMQPKTRSLADIPATKEALDFVRTNPEVAEKYPLVYGYFVPQGGEFDFEAYRRQIERGTREAVAPEQAVALANARVANFIYQQAKAKVGAQPGQAGRDWLYNVKQALAREYPGFGDYTGLTERATVEQRIEQVERAATDARLDDTPAAKAIRTYLTARKQAQATAESQGLRGYETARSARPIRTWLRAVGEALARETPDFEAAWLGLFSREVDVAGEEQEAVA